MKAIDTRVFFTSINNAYLVKAMIMVASLRAHHPNSKIYCILADLKDPEVDYSFFDRVFTIDDLNIPVVNINAWIFAHSVVELCTAVKPFAFDKIFIETGCSTVTYLDPDTVVFDSFNEVFEALDGPSRIVLTPHVTTPAENEEDIFDGELFGCLHHGVFNLGFLGLRNVGEGSRFLKWWQARCRDYCFDDQARFLFTDQKWVDLAPGLFQDIKIMRHPGYNMATWNLYYRFLEKAVDGRHMVNKLYPLKFFHFSGFDKGVHDLMLKKHAPDSQTMFELTAWYRAQLIKFEPEKTSKSFYDFYSNGEPIKISDRLLLRTNKLFQLSQINPFVKDPYQE